MGHIAIIFAKSGSIGFPGKNMLEVDGRPLIALTLDELAESNCFDKIYVSSNADEILDYSLEAGVDVIRRGNELAENARFVDAVDHAISSLEEKPETITIPQVVQPFREPGIFRRMLDLMKESQADSVVTVKDLESSLDWMYNIDGSGSLKIPRQMEGKTGEVIARENRLVEIDNAVVLFSYESWARGQSITPWPYLGNSIFGVQQKLLNRNMALDLHLPEDGEWFEFIRTFPAWKSQRGTNA